MPAVSTCTKPQQHAAARTPGAPQSIIVNVVLLPPMPGQVVRAGEVNAIAAAAQPPGHAVGSRPTALSAAQAEAAAASIEPALFEEAGQVDASGALPSRSLALLHTCGLLAAPLPESVGGGAGLNAPHLRRSLLRVLAHLGRGSLPVGRLYEGHVNALGLIEAFAAPEAAARWFCDAAAGHLFAVWNTEDAAGLRLVADQPGRWQLQGAKTFASGVGTVSRALLTARDDAGGWQMLVVDTDIHQPEIDRAFWKPLGMRSTGSFKADFNHCTVRTTDLVGAPGDYGREPAFSGGAVRFAAVQQGGIEAVFDATRAFLVRLGRTDDPHQRARLGEMAACVAGGRQWLLAAAQHAVAPADPPAESGRAVAHAHLMRTAIESNALRVLQLAARSVGARGLLAPEPFERLHRDLTHYLRQAGPDAALTAAGTYVLSHAAPAYALWNE